MSETEVETNKLGHLKNEQDEDDDIPCLSAETFKALQEFYCEREAIEKNIDENWV
jgi:hypothetical protein